MYLVLQLRLKFLMSRAEFACRDCHQCSSLHRHVGFMLIGSRFPYKHITIYSWPKGRRLLGKLLCDGRTLKGPCQATGHHHTRHLLTVSGPPEALLTGSNALADRSRLPTLFGLPSAGEG